MVRVVTMSAAYGTQGAVIGPLVAERLGVPFVDRAIPNTVARNLGIDEETAHAQDETVEPWLVRALGSLALVPPLSAEAGLLPGGELAKGDLRRETERVLVEQARVGGVILGRAGAVLLREHADVLHVRLDAPVHRRVRQIMTERGFDEATARAELQRVDRARAGYVRQFYGCNAADPRLYHLMVDSTAVPLPTVVDVILTAAAAAALAPTEFRP